MAAEQPKTPSGQATEDTVLKDRLAFWRKRAAALRQKQAEPDEMPDAVARRLSRAERRAAFNPFDWPPERIEFAEDLWGDSCIQPGSPLSVVDRFRPLGPNEAMSLADLSAGIGGCARELVRQFGVWVDGFEAAPALAEYGMQLSRRYGMARKCPIRSYDPESPDLKAKAYHFLLAREATFHVKSKTRYFRALANALKQNGHLILHDYFRADRQDGAASASLRAWQDYESGAAHVAPLDKTLEGLRALKFEVRAVEDITDRHQVAILGAWLTVRDQLDPAFVSEEHRLAILNECDLWTARWQALESGAVTFQRIHAISRVRRGGTGVETMADWSPQRAE